MRRPKTMFCSQKLLNSIHISKSVTLLWNWVTGRSGKEAKEGNSCWYGGGGSLKSPSIFGQIFGECEMMRHDGVMCEEFVNSIQVLSVYSVCFLEKCPTVVTES